LSETWLDSSTSDAEIKLPGFVCIRQDRTGNKEGYGGVAMYDREAIRFGVSFAERYQYWWSGMFMD